MDKKIKAIIYIRSLLSTALMIVTLYCWLGLHDQILISYGFLALGVLGLAMKGSVTPMFICGAVLMSHSSESHILRLIVPLCALLVFAVQAFLFISVVRKARYPSKNTSMEDKEAFSNLIWEHDLIVLVLKKVFGKKMDAA